MMRAMKIDRLLTLLATATLSACGGDTDEAATKAAESQRPTREEIAAVEAETSYRAPESKNPPGVTEDDIVLLREGKHFKIGYVGKKGEFVEIPERGTLPVDDSGFLPPFSIYSEE